MKSTHVMRWAAAFALLAAVPCSAFAADADQSAKTIAPYLDAGTVAVGRLDLAKLDVPEIFKTIAKYIPARPQDLASAQAQGIRLQKQLREQKVTELFTVISLTDAPRNPAFVIVPVGAGGDHRKVAGIMFGGKPDGPTSRDPNVGVHSPFETCVKLGNVVYCGPEKTLDRLKANKPSPRPHLAAAFAAVKGSAAQLAFVPSKDHHRVLSELMPRLPKDFGGMTGPEIAKAVQWAALGVNPPPKLKLTMTVQSDTAASAERLKETLFALGKLAAKQASSAGGPSWAEFATIPTLLAPKVEGSQLRLMFDPETDGGKRILAMVATAGGQARKAAARSSSTNNLKQFGLALHNFHDVYKSFPPHASYSKKEKPMLSWRVYVLPYIEGNELFKQFHLDEPWDSDHNKKLIAKMPRVFKDPSGLVKKAGMTRYVAPIGPKCIFDGKPEGTRLRDITDGTSNTILLVEAAPEKAVIWTKPDDLPIDEKDPKKGLLAKDAKGFNALFGDGSVHFLAKKLDAKKLWALFTRNGGEVVGDF